MSVLDPTLDYQSKQLENSSYTHMKIVRQSGVSTASPGEDCQWEIPVQAVNLARSYMTVEYKCDAPAAGAGNFNFIHEGIVPFQSIQLFTRGGQYLCDIRDYASDYSRVAMTYDSTDAELEEGSTAPRAEPLHAANENVSDIGHLANGSNAKSYWQQQYLYTPGDNTVIDGSTDSKTYKLLIPFKAIKDTIFEVDKSILFREVLVLKVKFGATDDLGYVGTTPNAAVASLTGLSFSGIYLYVAQERNASVVEALNAQTNSQEGFSLLVPYPSVYRNNRDSTQQNVTLRLNKSNGSSLKKIQTACFSGSTDKNRRYDFHNTRGGSKVNEYYTNINNNRLTEFNVNVADNLDWMIIRKRCKGTPVYNEDIYRNNWIIEDGFSNNADKMSDMKTKDTNVYSGISLDEEIRYDVYATTSNTSHNWLSLVHSQKVLNINQSGLIIG
jgi:hypothetical protein